MISPGPNFVADPKSSDRSTASETAVAAMSVAMAVMSVAAVVMSVAVAVMMLGSSCFLGSDNTDTNSVNTLLLRVFHGHLWQCRG